MLPEANLVVLSNELSRREVHTPERLAPSREEENHRKERPQKPAF